MSLYSDTILGTTGLVAYYRLGEPSGSFVDSKNALNGTASGSLSRGAAAVINPADPDLACTFSGGRIDIADNNTLDLGDTFSIEAWIYGTDFSTTRAIVSKGSQAYYLRVRSNAGNNKLVALKSFSAEVAIGSTTLSTAVVYHVVWTKNGATNKLYINGVDDSATVTNATCTNNSAGLQIGQDRSTEPFAGRIDEVALYSTELSSGTVAAHYLAGISAGIDSVVANANATGIAPSISAGANITSTAANANAAGIAPSLSAGANITSTAANANARGIIPDRIGEVIIYPGVEYPNDKAAFYIENPDGTTRRVAGDELSLPLSDYELNSALPGGYTTCDGDGVLPRRGIVDFGKFARASVRLPDGTEIWSGRAESTPTRSDDGTLRLACAGHQSQIVDTDGIVFLGVSSDMSRWEEPPRSYIESVNASNSVNAAFSASAGEEGITIRIDADRNVANTARGEMWFRAPGDQEVAEIQYVTSDSLATNMTSSLRVKDTPGGSTVDSVTTTNDLNVHSWVPTSPAQYAAFRDTPTTTVNKASRALVAHAMSLFGDHDLPRAPIDDLPDGLYFSDIESYLVPLLTGISTEYGGDSTIEPSTFALANAAWLDPTSLATILEDGLTYQPGRTWAVWNGPTYFSGGRGSMGRTWVADRMDGARFIDSGETAEPDFNCVVVVFTDSDGRQRTAGPPGGGYDHEDASLLDPDPDNPVTAAGLGRRPYVVDIGDAKPDRAIEYGQLALSEAIKRRFTGDVELPRYAKCDGVLLPTNMARADDWVLDSANGERMPLASASYARSRTDRPFAGTIDSNLNRLDVALARAAARPVRIKRNKIRRRYRRQNHRLARQRRARRN